MKRRKVLAVALASTMLFAMTGCGNTSTETTGSNAGASGNADAASIIRVFDLSDLSCTLYYDLEANHLMVSL